LADAARAPQQTSSGVTPLALRLRAEIASNGPMPVSAFMQACLYDPTDGYYARRAALGAGGDFLTAPEASQMFGELIGVWTALCQQAMHAPDAFDWIELGPGAGTLCADALRALKIAPEIRNAMRITLLEINPDLRARQIAALASQGATAMHVATLDAIAIAPSVLVANEFFDCLPIRQFVRMEAPAIWREKLVGVHGDHLVFGLGPPLLQALVPRHPGAAPWPATVPGAVWEIAPDLERWADAIAARFLAAPGYALIIDYGAPHAGFGDTFQALRSHEKRDPLAEPGHADLTAHLDFSALAGLARARGLAVYGPVSQARFLQLMGIEARARALMQAQPHKADSIRLQLQRLTAPDQMGELFQVLCLTSPTLPAPAGFP
jgi:NADH dehydrogenase [ubiquinone] 1 alpha subcomplex assembly factor 7